MAMDDVTPEHDIFLLTNPAREHIPANGIRMDYSRTLASYRIKREDILLFHRAQAQSQAWAEVTGTQITLIITSAEFNLTKAFNFTPTDTFETVVVHFLEKANVRESKWFFVLLLNVAGETAEMQHDWTLADFPLPKPARLELGRKKRDPRLWFGTDPSTLPMLRDPGESIGRPLHRSNTHPQNREWDRSARDSGHATRHDQGFGRILTGRHLP